MPFAVPPEQTVMLPLLTTVSFAVPPEQTVMLP